MSARPPLKIKLSTAPKVSNPDDLPTPKSTGTTKIKLKIGSGAATPITPSEAPALPASKKKSGRKPKTDKPALNGTPSSANSKKRVKTEDDDEEEVVELSRPQIKKLKLNTRAPSTPFVRIKAKGKPPHRPLGVGYDSEASDREVDPHIEEEFILRMAPCDDCEYLRKAIEDKRFGPRNEGGADIKMKFLTRDGRRAVVTIRGRHYAASLVDLPCVVEGMKSWDRKGWWKSADICQMLLVLGRVPTEDAAMSIPLPSLIDSKTFQFPHGLTPPMHYVRKRRFRKRVSNRTIEAVEEEVERLLQADEDCEGPSRYEVLDLDRMTREASMAQSDSDGGYNMLGNAGMHGSDYGDHDAEGDLEENYFDEAAPEEDGEGLEADLEMAMMMENEMNGTSTANSSATAGAVQPPLDSTVPTPTVMTSSAKEDSGDDSSDADAEENEGPDEVDEDVLEQQQDMLRQREEIADLEAAIRSQTTELERLQNPILRQKLMKKIQSLRGDLDLKKAAIGEGGDD
ncbi:MAG: hypothetical protein M1830_005680 [Pleopsidium flavum]|nr:MAG: hypothetical protein M1830_005680 [Pleopsidium flavum]